MQKYLYIILILLIIMVACENIENTEMNEIETFIQTSTITSTSEKMQTGDIIHFGDYEWRILELYENNVALIITENIIKTRQFHNYWEEITWEECDLRLYLNSTFLDTFTNEERYKILPTQVSNIDNEWFWIPGGNDTIDYVFILSIEEVVRFFGDSGQLKNPISPQYGIRQYLLSDQYNNNRISTCENGEAQWWWLRSIGFSLDFASFTDEHGVINVSGAGVNADLGVRPVLLLNIG